MSLNCKKYPAHIRLDEDVLKTPWGRLLSSSSEDVLKKSSIRLDQDEYIRLSHLSSEDFFKTSSRHLDQDQYIRLDHTSSTRVQDVLKTSSRRLAKTSSRHLQDVFKTFWRRLQDLFKTSLIRLSKTSSKRHQDVCKNVFNSAEKKYLLSQKSAPQWGR